MKLLEKEKIEVALVKDIVCNKCGEICTQLEHAGLKASWGYHSNKDLEDHESHLCEECYGDIIKSFRIPPAITERGL